MRRHLSALFLHVLTLGAYACSSSSSSPAAPEASPEGGTSDAGASSTSTTAGDAADADSSSVVLADAGPPQIQRGAGPILQHPKLVAITFASDPNAAILDTLVAQLPPSAYWSEVTSEYGIDGTVSLPAVHAAESAPSSIEYLLKATADGKLSFEGADSVTTSWLTTQLGTAGALPPADGTTLYAIFYPTTTKHVLRAPGADGGPGETANLCEVLSAYHSGLTLSDGRHVPYVVIPEVCSTTKDVTVSATHELIEAVTDPDPQNHAWRYFDANHGGWDLLSASEVTDACAVMSMTGVTAPGIDFPVARSWSNAAVRAGHHPCVPSQGQPYAVATPDAPDEVSYTGADGPVVTRGLRVPIGTTRTIDLHLSSDAPAGRWNIVLVNIGDSAGLKIDFDRTDGVAGDTIKMTIQAVKKPEDADHALVTIGSVDDPKTPSRVALAPLVVTF